MFAQALPPARLSCLPRCSSIITTVAQSELWDRRQCLTNFSRPNTASMKWSAASNPNVLASRVTILSEVPLFARDILRDQEGRLPRLPAARAGSHEMPHFRVHSDLEAPLANTFANRRLLLRPHLQSIQRRQQSSRRTVSLCRPLQLFHRPVLTRNNARRRFLRTQEAMSLRSIGAPAGHDDSSNP